MAYKDLAAVSGLPGLYKVVDSRSNGVIVADLDNEKSRFVSSRKHQITPLETVSIYTTDDATALKDIFFEMQKQEETLSLPSAAAPTKEQFEYFGKIVPDYDTDRVLVSDVKKVIKWYKFLKARDLLVTEEEDQADSSVKKEEEE